LTVRAAVREDRLISEGSYNERLEQLRSQYLQGAITPEEYGRRRNAIVTGQPVEEVEAPLEPTARTLPVAAPPPAIPVAPGLGPDPWIDVETGLKLASWSRRVAASLLDAVFILAVLIPVLVWAVVTADPVTGELRDPAASVLFVASVFLPYLYTWIMLGARGATMGKLTVGIVVVRGEDGGRIGYAKALGRVASVFFLSILVIPILVSDLWPLWDRRCQTFQDKMVNTVVVVENPRPKPY
jgi:uncharacterized RDD family membrane protein YckC